MWGLNHVAMAIAILMHEDFREKRVRNHFSEVSRRGRVFFVLLPTDKIGGSCRSQCLRRKIIKH